MDSRPGLVRPLASRASTQATMRSQRAPSNENVSLSERDVDVSRQPFAQQGPGAEVPGAHGGLGDLQGGGNFPDARLLLPRAG